MRCAPNVILLSLVVSAPLDIGDEIAVYSAVENSPPLAIEHSLYP
jgi:hypothetical protein